MESNVLHYFCVIFFSSELGLLLKKKKKSYIFGKSICKLKCKFMSVQSDKPLSCAAILNCMKNRMQEKKIQHFSAIKKKSYVYLKSFLFISMVELDHWRSAAKTLVNKIGLNA